MLNVEETLPTIHFQRANIKGIQTQTDGLVVELDLWYEFSNPFKKALPVPAHSFSFKINQKLIQKSDQKKFSVPAKKKVTKPYRLTLELTKRNINKFKSFLGKDNQYEFATNITLDLHDFLEELSDYNIMIPKNAFTNAVQPKAEDWLKEKLGKKTFTIKHEDEIRIPLLPIVKPSANPMTVRFAGQMETLDLQILKDAMVPLGDLIVSGNLNQTISDPFIQKLENTSVTIPTPTLLEWDKTTTINLADHVMDLLQPFDENIEDKWDNLKDKISPPTGNSTALMDHLVNVYLTQIDQNADDYWTNFKTQWAAFKNTPAEIKYPGANVTGLIIEVPFIIENKNEFSIKVPHATTTAQLGNYTPLAFQISDPSGSIPKKQSKEVKMTLMLDWQAATGGFAALLNGQSLSPNLIGEVSLDLGYGPMKVQMNLQDILMSLGE